MPHRILIATENRGKLRELEALLREMNLELITPSHLGLNLDVIEDGNTYAENAAKKARAYNQATGLVTLADDSGLEVEALNGQPGIRSARYAPWENATDADRRRYLLNNLQGKPRPWPARFVATIAIALIDGSLHYATGTCTGEIIPVERGDNGFGYDPIFLVSGLDKTMAELTMEEKNILSHRARAIHQAKRLLVEVFDR